MHVIALARSPSAFQAIRSIILNLQCDATLKGYMNQHSSNPGINDRVIKESSERYKKHAEERVKTGHIEPIQDGILIWDETKFIILSIMWFS